MFAVGERHRFAHGQSGLCQVFACYCGETHWGVAQIKPVGKPPFVLGGFLSVATRKHIPFQKIICCIVSSLAMEAGMLGIGQETDFVHSLVRVIENLTADRDCNPHWMKKEAHNKMRRK